MAYFPGAGVKKPLNIIEGPMFPDIKQTLPRFVDAGKHWTVDTGATVLDTGHLDQTLNGAILAQSRSYNQTVYGQSSSKDVVNKNFRPPLLSQDDFLPLSRQPRKIVVPRINPSGVADSYFTQNNRPGEIDSYLTDRVKQGEWRPTFFAPITFPNDSNAILPDLELTLPNYTASAGINTPAKFDAPPQMPVLVGGREEFTLLLDSGVNIPIALDGDVVRDFDLPLKRPHYKAGARMNTPLTLDMENASRAFRTLGDPPPLFGRSRNKQPRPVGYGNASRAFRTPGEPPPLFCRVGNKQPCPFGYGNASRAFRTPGEPSSLCP